MNWTGGSLQRTKKAGQGILQKQKAHFARARARVGMRQQDRTDISDPQFRLLHVGNDNRDPFQCTGPYPPDALRISKTCRVTKEQPRVSSHIAFYAGNCIAAGNVHHDTIISHPKQLEAAHQELNVIVMADLPIDISERKRRSSVSEIETQLLQARRTRLSMKRVREYSRPSCPTETPYHPSRGRLSAKQQGRVNSRWGVHKQHKQRDRVVKKKPRGKIGGMIGLDPGEWERIPLDSIRIRIGTEVLRTVSPKSEGSQICSTTSSDSMLFEPSDQTKAYEEDISPAHQPNSTSIVSRFLASQHDTKFLGGILGHSANKADAELIYCDKDRGLIEDDELRMQGTRQLNISKLRSVSSNVEEDRYSDADCCVMYQSGNTRYPLQLIFSDSKSPNQDWLSECPGWDSKYAANTDCKGHMGGEENCYMNGSEGMQAHVNGPSPRRLTPDEVAWRALCGFPDESRWQSSLRPSSTRRLMRIEEERGRQTQHEESYCNTMPPETAKKVTQMCNNVELLWRTFVFGNDEDLAKSSMEVQARANTSSFATSQVHAPCCSTWLPVSSSPVRPVSDHASGTANVVQGLTKSATAATIHTTPPVSFHRTVPAETCWNAGRINCKSETAKGSDEGIDLIDARLKMPASEDCE